MIFRRIIFSLINLGALAIGTRPDNGISGKFVRPYLTSGAIPPGNSITFRLRKWISAPSASRHI